MEKSPTRLLIPLPVAPHEPRPSMCYKLLVALILFLVFQYLYTNSSSGFILPQLRIITLNESSLGHHSPLFSPIDDEESSYDRDVKNITAWIQSQITTTGVNQPIPQCPLIPPNLVGVLGAFKEGGPLAELEIRVGSELLPGGQWRPSHCKARDKVAIIIPYRDRLSHLSMLLANIHPFLQRQLLDYGIFVVEQSGESEFNRAMLFNVGFVEALKLRDFDCFIFHDVDLLPEDDRNLYTCPDQPRHMSVAVDIFNYRLPYSDLFGGVSAMTKWQFQKVNGFSNKYWGWGGEDDDMAARIRVSGLHISRYPANIARYTMLAHTKQKANPKRFERLYQAKKRIKTDGLNSLKYHRKETRLNKLFTWVLVELIPS